MQLIIVVARLYLLVIVFILGKKMRKVILSVFVIITLLASASFAVDTNKPVAYDFKKCASAATADSKKCKSRSKRAREAKAKCESMTDVTQKEICFKEIEEKAAAKKAEDNSDSASK